MSCHKSVYCRKGWKDRAGFLGRFDLILTVGWKSSEMPVCAGNLDSHMVPWAHPRTGIYPKRHVSWFIRFCRAHGRDQQTDTQTTTQTTERQDICRVLAASVAMHAMRHNNVEVFYRTVLTALPSSSSSILFQAARPIKTQQAKRQTQTEQAYKYTDEYS